MYYVSNSYNCHKIIVRGHSQVEKPCKIIIIILILSPENRYMTLGMLCQQAPTSWACSNQAGEKMMDPRADFGQSDGFWYKDFKSLQLPSFLPPLKYGWRCLALFHRMV